MSRPKLVVISLIVSCALSLAFGARHFFGMAFHGDHYSPFSYAVGALHQANIYAFAFKPDTVVWDETRGYARFTREVMRGEVSGAGLASYSKYLAPGPPLSDSGWPINRLGPITLALMAFSLNGSLANAFILSDFVFIFLLSLLYIRLSYEISDHECYFSIVATAAILCFNW
jgi:hypothetical protein